MTRRTFDDWKYLVNSPIKPTSHNRKVPIIYKTNDLMSLKLTSKVVSKNIKL